MEIVEEIPKPNRKLIAIIRKNLWSRKNTLTFEGKFASPRILMHAAINQQDTFQSTRFFESHSPLSYHSEYAFGDLEKTSRVLPKN